MRFRELMLAASAFGPHLALAAFEFNLPSSPQQAFQQYLPSWLSSYATPSVTLPQGRLIGTVVDDGSFPAPIEAFLGIPYALPPIDQLRFARPQPVKPSTQVLDASRYGPICPGRQLLQIPGSDFNSEDCLTANVFRHSNSSSRDKVPVIIYVHGGAFNRGSGKMHNTASMVAWSAEPFIAVSFNYRIGAPGFLNSALMENEGVLNLGLRDQILLFEWVNENVAAFGGDPDNVTLMGVSAGAHSIGHHIMNINSERQLFHRAIIESGGPTSRAVHPYHSELHEQQFKTFLSEVQCNHVPLKDVLQCLREVPSAKIIEASNDVFMASNPSVRWAWQPVIDNDIISRRPPAAWQSGNWRKIPILTGFNHNEGTMYVSKELDDPSEFEAFFATLLPQLSQSDIKRLSDLYPDPLSHSDSPYSETRPLDLGSQFKRTEAAYGQYAYVCPVRQTANLATADSADPPVYLYHWATNRTVLGGANHADQMGYETMDPDIRAISSTQEEIAGLFHAYLTSFIVTGDPNSIKGRFAHRPPWHKSDKMEKPGKTMVFGLGNDERAGGGNLGVPAWFVRDDWAKRECEFWWEQSWSFED